MRANKSLNRTREVDAAAAAVVNAGGVIAHPPMEVPDGKYTDYRNAVQAGPGEKIVLSWIIWPDREASAKAYKGMFTDQRMVEAGEMPFDGRRMILGGFEPILTYRKTK